MYFCDMKVLYILFGTLSLALGIIGIFLPLLPTTPFLLLTAALYVRSSPRLYNRLLHHKYLGSYIRNLRKKHQSKGDRNKENQTQPVVNKRFCSRLPLQPNSRERQDNARFPLPSHYLFRNLPEA